MNNVILSAAKNLGYKAGIRLDAVIEILHSLCSLRMTYWQNLGYSALLLRDGFSHEGKKGIL